MADLDLHPSKVGMNLLLELIDEIICNLASDGDFKSLRRCPLVAKSWTHPSRKRLLENILVSRETHLSWLDRISPGDGELLHNVRPLTYVLDLSAWCEIEPPSHRIDSFYRHLPSFRRLKFLGLFSVLLGPDIPRQIGLFSAFQHTLSSLPIHGCHIPSNALTALINYFPLLVDLNLCCLTYEADGGPICQLSRPLRASLSSRNARPKTEPSSINCRTRHQSSMYWIFVRSICPLSTMPSLVFVGGASNA